MFLDVRDLTITLKTGEEIAEDISFSIDGGEMLSIVGSSGAGKTTVSKAVMGLLSSNYSLSGEVLYKGENLLRASKKRLQAIYGKEICYIMQNPMTAFNPSLRIGRQLEKTCYLHNPQISRQELQNLEAKRCAYDAVQEYIDTIKELKAYSKTDVYLDELDKKLENVIRCSFRNELAPGASTTAAQFILRFGLVAVLLIGGNLVIEGMLSIPMLILFLLFAGRIYDPFTNCFMLLAEVFAALVSIGRMKQIDNTQEQTGSDCYNNIGYDIEFKDVHFSYNEEPVLAGVSFVAKQGEITALVGPSGSGKSTVSKLAARFWDADSGLITLGGIDVKTVEPEVLLKNYAIVFQNVTLFDESVMENIRLGRSGASDEDVRAAAKAAQCDEFIDRLPQGYDTNIGENGSKLSGGERQRISIARALLKNAPVILLDEATASMDAESETMVQTALSALLKGRTVIVIAHRMRTIANADKIVVLDKGKVTEMGTPSELAKKGGLYEHLVALQQKQQMSSLPT